MDPVEPLRDADRSPSPWLHCAPLPPCYPDFLLQETRGAASAARRLEGAAMPLNVMGTELRVCCLNPAAGFTRDGQCTLYAEDLGEHTVCALMTDEFLRFSKARGNDLSTPRPDLAFPGLKAGDKWCLCVGRWIEALQTGAAPAIDLEATHVSVLQYVDLDTLKLHAAPPDPASKYSLN